MTLAHFSDFMTPLPPPLRRRRLWMAPYVNVKSNGEFVKLLFLENRSLKVEIKTKNNQSIKGNTIEFRNQTFNSCKF